MSESPIVAMLKSSDMARTIDWYRRAGFDVRAVHPEVGSPTWREVGRDGVAVQFLAGDTPWDGTPRFTGTLYIHPPSVEAVYDQIRGDIEPVWGPEIREWGTRELGLQDPDGYFLTFTEQA